MNYTEENLINIKCILITGGFAIAVLIGILICIVPKHSSYDLSNGVSSVRVKSENNSTYSFDEIKKNILNGRFYFGEKYGKNLFLYYGNDTTWDLLAFYSDSESRYISAIDIQYINLKYVTDKQALDYINSFVHTWCDKMNNSVQ
jgi:hypothetical protein